MSNTNGCESFVEDDFDLEAMEALFENNTTETPIVMVERGDCDFATKV